MRSRERLYSQHPPSLERPRGWCVQGFSVSIMSRAMGLPDETVHAIGGLVEQLTLVSGRRAMFGNEFSLLGEFLY